MPGPGSAGEVYIDVLPWMKDFEQKLSKSTQTLATRASKRMVSTGKTLSKFVTLPLLAGAGAAIKLASDASETENKIRVIFGKMANSVIAWSATSIKRMGFARQTAQDMAAQFAAVFQAAKLPGPAVADMSQKFTQLAADMASFFNVPADEALAALRSGLVGETEPLRRFGVLLSEAAVKTEALRLGLVKEGEALTEQQKVQARTSVIMRSLNKASGDYARTAEGVANKTRATSEMAKELGARFGQMLLPIMQKLLGVGQKFLGWLDSLSPAGRKTMMMILGVVAVVGPLLIIFGKMIMAIKGTVAAFKALNLAFMVNPWFLLAIATIAIAVLIFKNWGKIKTFLIRTWNALKTAATKTWNAILNAIGEVLAMLLKGFRTWLAFWFSFVGAFLRGAAAAFGWLPGIGGKLKAARDSFDRFRDKVLGSLDSQIRKFKQWGNVVIGQLAAGTEAARRLERQMAQIRPPPGGGRVPRFQHGGVVRSPFQWTGERGPELAAHPIGTRIVSNADLRRLLAGVGGRVGGGNTYQANVTGIMEPITAKEIQTIFRRMEFLAGES